MELFEAIRREHEIGLGIIQGVARGFAFLCHMKYNARKKSSVLNRSAVPADRHDIMETRQQ